MRRAQLSVEFLIILALLLIVFVAILSGVRTRRSHVQAISDDLAARRVADRISGTVARLIVLGDGANESYYVPAQLDGRTNYTIHIHNESHILSLQWDDIVTSTLITSAVNTSSVPTGRKIHFRNVGGVVEIG